MAGVIALALKALSAERRAGEQMARANSLDVNLTNLAAMLADAENRHREEKERADRLDDAVSQMVADMVAGPVDGATRRLLQKANATKSARGDGARELHPPRSADVEAGTELLDPSLDG
jgi:hypothetical protein